jgi:hypothetical protein
VSLDNQGICRVTPLISENRELPRVETPATATATATWRSYPLQSLLHLPAGPSVIDNYLAGCDGTEAFSTVKNLDLHKRSKHAATLQPTDLYEHYVQACEGTERFWGRHDVPESHLSPYDDSGIEGDYENPSRSSFTSVNSPRSLTSPVPAYQPTRTTLSTPSHPEPHPMLSPSGIQAQSFRSSKYEWAVAADLQDSPMPTFQTSTFKNSHYNTANYNNPNFQPEEWSPEEEGLVAVREEGGAGSGEMDERLVGSNVLNRIVA